MAPIVNGTTTSEPIKIQNNNNGTLLSEDIVKLDNLPEDVKELCSASLKVKSINHHFTSKPDK